ncbi:MAG: phosphatidate cytidylyltransferase [Chloroflexi bacterium]|nr:phosphatidate cytidylyltransferase [Chloroflexota bacterium]
MRRVRDPVRITTVSGEALPAPALSNLKQRLITGALGIPVALLVVILGGWLLTVAGVAVAVIGVLEFYAVIAQRGLRPLMTGGVLLTAALTVSAAVGQPLWGLGIVMAGGPAAWMLGYRRPRDLAVTLAGVLYVGAPLSLLLLLRAHPDGLAWLLFVLVLTWSTDSFAYVGGRWWGRTPLAPHISPQKTLEGALIGTIGGVGAGMIVLWWAGLTSPATLLLVSTAPLAVMIGDLLESGLKRVCQVKDSHLAGLNLLPGHGGILDRIDGLLLAAVLCAAVIFTLPA